MVQVNVRLKFGVKNVVVYLALRRQVAGLGDCRWLASGERSGVLVVPLSCDGQISGVRRSVLRRGQAVDRLGQSVRWSYREHCGGHSAVCYG